MKIIPSVFCTLLFVLTLSVIANAAEPPPIEWEKTFSGLEYKEANAVQETADGGFIVTGHERGRVYLLKLSRYGDKQWERAFGRTADGYRGRSVHQTIDGGYVIGAAIISSGTPHFYLIKTDPNGEAQWERTFGVGDCCGAHPTGDGGYIMAGTDFADVRLVKTDASGAMQWEKTLHVGGEDYPYDIQRTTDGGYVVVGEAMLSGTVNGDVFLLKTDASGTLDWARTYVYGCGRSVRQTADGGFVVAGVAFGKGLYLLKTDSGGSVQWETMLRGGDGWAVCESSEGGYIAAGVTPYGEYSPGGVYIFRTNAIGEMVWEKTIAYRWGNAARAVLETTDGGFVVAGTNAVHEAYVIKLAAELPNLTVSNVDAGPVAPVELRPGDPLVLGAFLENIEAGAAGPFWLEFWGSRTGGLTLDLFLGDSIWFPGLAGGGTLSVAETRPLYSIPDGPYTVVFAVDRPGEVVETNERDNRAVVGWKRLLVYRPPSDADLVVESFTFGPNPVHNGETLQLGGFVRNIGTEDTGGFWIEFWGSYDRAYPDLHFFLCDSIPVANLAPGAAVDLSQYERTLYNCPTGVFAAGVYADRFVSVNERDETNNYRFIDGISFNQPLPAVEAQAVGPDLVVASADFAPWSPVKLEAGSPLVVSARIENRGAEASGPFWVEFWGAEYGGLHLREFLVDSEYVMDLPPGDAVDLAFERPLYSIPDGPYTVDVVVDRPNDVAETNEGNNLLAIPGKRLLVVRPQTHANLVIENFAVTPNPLKAGMPIWMSGTVRNAGAGPSGPFWIEFWGSHDQDYPNLGFMLCDSIYIPGLDPGATVDLSTHTRVLYPHLPTGPCAILCFADRTDLVNELNETDNYAILRDCSVGQCAEEATILLPGDVPLVMVHIPAGSFPMGTAGGRAGDPGWAQDSEAPAHTVHIAYDFHMGKYELTQQQWLALMGSWPATEPHSSSGRGDNYPAYYVSWNDAQNFIRALNTHVTSTGQGPATFRLPSEAEWEYACRAGSTMRFCFGDSTLAPWDCNPGPPGDLGDYAWFCGNNGLGWGYADFGSKEAGTKLPSAFGLYDMHGNVREWCQDRWHDSYTGAPADGSAWETPTGSYRVVRGSHWGSSPEYCRSASRSFYPPGNQSLNIGFRLARAATLVQKGVITIDVKPDEGNWTLTGPLGFSTLTGTGDRTSASAIADAPPGDYTLTCDDNVLGYDPPASQTQTLAPGATIAFTPTYTPEPGVITIDVTPDEGNWTLTGPAAFATLTGTGDRTGAAAITNAPPGDYTLTCDATVPGYDPPPFETQTLVSGGTIAFTPTYTPEPGTITIDVTPDAGSWALKGPAAFASFTGIGDRKGAAALTNALPGDYTLTCDDNVSGYDPPASESLTLVPGGMIAFTPWYTLEVGPNEIGIILPGDVPLVMVRIPAGSFQMGSPDTERSRWSNEGPVHTVDIAYDFYMGKYELTQQQWLALMSSWPGTASNPTFGWGDTYPAYYISWNDCQNFVTALNTHIANTGQGPATFRLPSEAEWEYACRAGTQTRFFFGDSLSVGDWCEDGPAGTLPGNRTDYMWYCANNGDYHTSRYGSKRVGRKIPNQFGLYDMSGNVWEWCQDWYHSSYTGAPADGSVWETPDAIHRYRVMRGGLWHNIAYSCRSASRIGYDPGPRSYDLGFRLARTAASAATGTITIDITPDAGSWALTGPARFATVTGAGDRLATAAITSAPPGDYTLTCDDNVPGYDPPASETLTLISGGTIAFTPTYIPETGPEEITILLPGDVPLVVVRIPAGSFTMGTPGGAAGDPGWAKDNEAPAYTVNIAYDFYMGKYEVTQQQWLALMGNWPQQPQPNATWGLGDNYPAYWVSWNDAQSFITALNTHVMNTNQGPPSFRLPSASEWEYSCRAGSTSRFCFGDSTLGPVDCDPGPAGDLGDYAWFCGNNGASGTSEYGSKEVGTKWPNQFGLYDMHGNVSEWCQDWQHDDYKDAPTDGSAWEIPAGTCRVMRGGSWSTNPHACRSAFVPDLYPCEMSNDRGFRLVRSMQPPQAGIITIDVAPDLGSWTLTGRPDSWPSPEQATAPARPPSPTRHRATTR